MWESYRFNLSDGDRLTRGLIVEEIDIANMPNDEFQRMMLNQIKDFEDSQKDNGSVFFDNVIKDDYENYDGHKDEFISRVLIHLNENFKSFDNYYFVIHSSDTSEFPNTKNLSYLGKKVVLIATSCEKKFSQFEKIKGDYHHIFANYHWDTDYVTSIPLGYYAKPNLDLIPMEERLYNMSFIGCLNRNRLQLASMLSKIPSLAIILSSYAKEYRILGLINHMVKWLHPRDYYGFTGDFGRGVDQQLYSNLLHSSKISLCPRGWSNVESFRIYESMRAGCVTITEALPDRTYYKGIPALQVDNWKDGLDLARYYLNHPYLLKKRGEECRKFYEEKLSPEATAKIIMDKLAEKAI
jgi:hypothetical protein